jgi:hypothetical protein
MAGKLDDSRISWITRTGPRVLQPQRTEKPSKTCYVCGKQRVTVTLNTHKTTLRQLYDVVLTKRLGMKEPSIDVTTNE